MAGFPTNYKYLGVHLDPTMNLDSHFNKTYKTASGRVNLLRRIRSNIDTLSAELIYRAMIMPASSLSAAKLRFVGERHVGAK